MTLLLYVCFRSATRSICPEHNLKHGLSASMQQVLSVCMGGIERTLTLLRDSLPGGVQLQSQ